MKIDVTRFGSTHYEYISDSDPSGKIYKGEPIELNMESLAPLQEGTRESGWMVIRTDNFGRSGEAPGFNEVVKVAGPLVEVEAKEQADRLNAGEWENGPYFYRAVQVGYKLEKFEA